MTPSNRRNFLKYLGGFALALATPPRPAHLAGQPLPQSSGKKQKKQADRRVFVIAAPCIGVKCGDCVNVCPVDCIHPRKGEPAFSKVDQLFIDPLQCIECEECVNVCPVDAIYEADRLPTKWLSYAAKNAKYFGRS